MQAIHIGSAQRGVSVRRVAIAIAAGALFITPVDAAQAEQVSRVTICHASGGKYVTITVPIDFAKGNGHLLHGRDIIPGPPGEGLNWDAIGTATMMNGCVKAKPADTDRDGLPDIEDPDDDGDGLVDARDLDDDGDGLGDESDADQETKRDTNGDGVPDAVDDDDDGDGIPDGRDPDRDGDSIPDTADRDIVSLTDTDSDGTPDATDADDDGDCVPDTVDKDRDGDGVTDATDRDLDNDGVPNGADLDDDGDGTPDVVDGDSGDDVNVDANVEAASQQRSAMQRRAGTLASATNCTPAAGPVDTDGDGTPDASDADDPDQVSEQDSDSDGVPDHSDSDDDGDGVPDDPVVSSTVDPAKIDSDGDGRPNATDPDQDGDGAPDVRDGDADGDGAPETLTQVLTTRALPPRLDADGETVLFRSPALTNARQSATVSVTCWTSGRVLRAKPSGDVPAPRRVCTVRTVGSKIVLDASPELGTVVIVQISAPARGIHRALDQARTYVVS